MATTLAPNTRVVTRESKKQEIGMLVGKKILSFPTTLGGSATDYAGNDESYIIIKINSATDGSKLKEDKAAGDVYTAATQGGTLSTIGRGQQILGIAGPNKTQIDQDLSTRYGNKAVSTENWTKRYGVTKLDRVIVLPMPAELTVDTDINYEDTNSGDLSNLTDAVATMGDAGSASGLMRVIGSLIASSAISGVGNAIKDAVGAGSHTSQDEAARKVLGMQRMAMNPRKEILFKDIGFRTFKWSYTLSPKNQFESDMIKEIVRTLRYYALPELNAGKLFYTFPAEFEIILMKGAKENDSIPRISTCVLENVSVTYSSGSNTWATMADGSPPETLLSMSFKELEIIDRNRVWNKDSTITSGY